jgi:hypothetical protein
MIMAVVPSLADVMPPVRALTGARTRFVPDSVTMALLLPPSAEYINVHETCFHLWEVAGDATPAGPR